MVWFAFLGVYHVPAGLGFCVVAGALVFILWLLFNVYFCGFCLVSGVFTFFLVFVGPLLFIWCYFVYGISLFGVLLLLSVYHILCPIKNIFFVLCGFLSPLLIYSHYYNNTFYVKSFTSSIEKLRSYDLKCAIYLFF